jgi:hypothetical protein
LKQVEQPNRIEGQVSFLMDSFDSGFIKDLSGSQFYFTRDQFLTDVDKENIQLHKKVKFAPVFLEKTGFAYQIEVLG